LSNAGNDGALWYLTVVPLRLPVFQLKKRLSNAGNDGALWYLTVVPLRLPVFQLKKRLSKLLTAYSLLTKAVLTAFILNKE
jgi:hypothetical protein